MRTSRFSEEQVLQILQEARAGTAVKVGRSLLFGPADTNFRG
jgi:hypothetical protein